MRTRRLAIQREVSGLSCVSWSKTSVGLQVVFAPSEAVWANDNNEDVQWLLNRTIPIRYIGKEFKRGVFGPLNADIDSLYLLSQILIVEQLSAQAL